MDENKNNETSNYFGNFLKHHHHHHSHHSHHSHSHQEHQQTLPEKPENEEKEKEKEKKYIPKEGDWECPEADCKNKNFARRDTCNRCGAPKPLKYYPVKGILILYNI
jgi:hypothetical protein